MRLLDQEPNFFESEAHAAPRPHHSVSPRFLRVRRSRRWPGCHVGAERELGEQEPALEGGTVNAFVRGDGGELVREAGVEVCVLQHVQEIEDTPAADDLLLEGLQARGFVQRLQSCSPPGPSRRPPASSTPPRLPATTLDARPPLFVDLSGIHPISPTKCGATGNGDLTHQ